MIELDQRQCCKLIARMVKEKTGHDIIPVVDMSNPMIELQLMHHMGHMAYDYFQKQGK